jgi:origin recognition complex subunit 1
VKPVAASAEPQMDLCTPSKPTLRRKSKSVTSPRPVTPATHSTVRRSLRLHDTPTKAALEAPVKATPIPASKAKRAAPSPKTPAQREPKRQRRQPRKRSYYRKVVYDGGEFEVGDDVYVKRREGAESDAEDPVEEECRVCFHTGGGVMVECDMCLGGFHLRCVRPPLRRVPEGDWSCQYCEAERAGKPVERPKPPEGKHIARTFKEKLLSSDMWAARIERSVTVGWWSDIQSLFGESTVCKLLIWMTICAGLF